MSADSCELETPHPSLARALTLNQAISLNVTNMVGVGPFITIPLFMSQMGGPHAVIAWVIAAVLVLCDGLVWSELGAALPGSGGTYHFLKETFGSLHPTWGRLMPFLFIWQFLISGTLEIASGYIGTKDYLAYIFPRLDSAFAAWRVPGGTPTIGAALCALMTLLLCRHVRILGWISVVLCLGTFAALLTVIVCGFANFNPGLLTFPKGELRWGNAGHLSHGLGAAMAIAIYDYLGYYNICHLGDEVRDPGRTIPRAVNRSIWIVAALYLAMNVAIIGVVPWQEAMHSKNIAADFMERLYGRPTAVAFAWLVVWTAMAATFAVTLGYSRIPFAAARRGDFFAIFGTLHAQGFPVVSLAAIGCLTAISCYFPLANVIEAAVAVRILVVFIGQIVALHLLRTRHPEVPMPFKMRLYPLPSLVALVGWLFVLSATSWSVLGTALGVTAAGLPVFFVHRALAAERAPTS